MNKTGLQKGVGYIVRYGYFVAIAALLVGLPLSRFLTSVAEFTLLLVWILDMALNRSFLVKLKQLFQNKAALALVSLYLIHVVGLLWTENFSYGFHDLRIKLPLLLFPVVFATMPIFTVKELRRLFSIYLLANLLGVFFALYYLFFREVGDIRQIVWFNSHIRFGLNLVLAIVISVWMMKGLSLVKKMPFIALIIIYFIFMLKQQAMTALVILCFIALFFALRFILISKETRMKIIMAALILLIGSGLTFYLYSIYKDTAVPKESKELSALAQTTEKGNPYYHNVVSGRLENGYWVEIYLAEPEMKTAWEMRSALPYDSLDLKGLELRETLIRYLTGKGLRKDAKGVAQLSDEDIDNIENGIANHHYAESANIKNRIRVTIWEIHVWRCCNQISNSSFVQRFELWRAALHTIKNNFWFGVGTGDALGAQKEAYIAIDSPLTEDLRARLDAHNQFLSTFSGLGIFGFLWFLFTLIYPGIKQKKFSFAPYLAFFIIVVLSMFTENTLETQPGATFFAFFNALFLFLMPKNQSLSKKT